jgi:hypothetical protein
LLHQHLAGALERRLRIGNAGILALLGGERSLEVPGRFGQRIECWIGEERLRQRIEAGLAGDLRLGAALGPERQVEVLEPLLRIGRFQALPELTRQLSSSSRR